MRICSVGTSPRQVGLRGMCSPDVAQITKSVGTIVPGTLFASQLLIPKIQMNSMGWYNFYKQCLLISGYRAYQGYQCGIGMMPIRNRSILVLSESKERHVESVSAV